MYPKEVVIIGAGPSGIATAIQLKRYGIEPVILEKEEIGGLLKNANLVENYPGFPDGISGPELVKLFKKQVENAGIRVRFEEILELDYKNEMFFIKTDHRELNSRIAVIASGTKPRKLSHLKITSDIEKRIFYEIYSLAQVENQKIVIIGCGDAAFDYALNLLKRNQVLILNREEKVKCLPLLWERAKETKTISYEGNTQVKEIISQEQGLKLVCQNHSGEYEMDISYLVVAIGREPKLDFLSENLKENLEKLQSLKVLYMIGDVKNGLYRQTGISIGEGIKAAMEIKRKINGEES